ncbi:hypothetical protein M5K25_016866 [Dendrobium thyrsiflorum]|uniref:Uncharacterized protein n=1 Tax=Dendrobium thyrsiflorum TaxID=117978 RepID=A0ABD0UKU7_DENTH
MKFVFFQISTKSKNFEKISTTSRRPLPGSGRMKIGEYLLILGDHTRIHDRAQDRPFMDKWPRGSVVAFIEDWGYGMAVRVGWLGGRRLAMKGAGKEGGLRWRKRGLRASGLKGWGREKGDRRFGVDGGEEPVVMGWKRVGDEEGEGGTKSPDSSGGCQVGQTESSESIRTTNMLEVRVTREDESSRGAQEAKEGGGLVAAESCHLDLDRHRRPERILKLRCT